MAGAAGDAPEVHKNTRANCTFHQWSRPGMLPGILRGCPLLGGAMCPNVVSRVVTPNGAPHSRSWEARPWRVLLGTRPRCLHCIMPVVEKKKG